MMKVGTFGQALLKAFAIEHVIVDVNGKWETRIPTCFELIERRMKPLSEEEALQKEAQKRRKYEQNHRNAIKAYEKILKALWFKRRTLQRRLKAIEKVLTELNQKLNESPTDTTLMRKWEYWTSKHFQLQNQYQYLTNELKKFASFLRKLRNLNPTEFPLWEDVGQTKGKPPRRYAEIGEYEDINGFSIHYLQEI